MQKKKSINMGKINFLQIFFLVKAKASAVIAEMRNWEMQIYYVTSIRVSMGVLHKWASTPLISRKAIKQSLII